MKSTTLDQYRVFGNPISHSRSPFIHQQFANLTGHKLNYETQFVEEDAFADAINVFIEQGGKGANVTVPFKEQAVNLVDHLSERARLAGAVNTILVKNGETFGDNTDGEGLVQDLIKHKVKLKGARILMIGAGGAARGVVLPLLSQQPHSITIANRTISKAEVLCQQFNSSKLKTCELTQQFSKPFDLIINATSASLSGEMPLLSVSALSPKTICYDMVYGKEKTAFLLWAQAHGVTQVYDGLGMLVGQAAESFSIWRGTKPEVDSVILQLRHLLNTER